MPVRHFTLREFEDLGVIVQRVDGMRITVGEPPVETLAWTNDERREFAGIPLGPRG